MHFHLQPHLTPSSHPPSVLVPSESSSHNIVNIYLYCAADRRFEDLRHQSLISGASVFESEWHDFVAIEVMRCYEGCFFFVSRRHGDLVVFGEGVQEGEHPLPSSGVHNLIHPWQREIVFWACIIEVGVVDAHPPFAFFFGYHHYICQPVRVIHFSDESDFQQLVYLIPDNFLPVQVKTSTPLPDGSGCWQDVKLMRGNGGMNSLHIRMCPCEDVMVLSEGVLHVPGLFWC